MLYAPPMPTHNPAAMSCFGQMYPNQYGGIGFFPTQPQLPASLFGCMPGAMPSVPWYPSLPSYPAPYDQALFAVKASLYGSQPAPSSATSATAVRQQEQEREIKKLEQQLDAMRVAEELKLEEQEFLKLQERISGLQVKSDSSECPFRRCLYLSIYRTCSLMLCFRKRFQVSLMPRHRVKARKR